MGLRLLTLAVRMHRCRGLAPTRRVAAALGAARGRSCCGAGSEPGSCPLWPPGLRRASLLCSWNSPGVRTGVRSRALLLGVVPPPGMNPGCGAERRPGSCGTRPWAWVLWGKWDLPRSGIKPVSPASAGGFATEAPGRSALIKLLMNSTSYHLEG